MTEDSTPTVAPPADKPKPKRKRNPKSYRVLQRMEGRGVQAKLKEAGESYVKVLTDDLTISLGVYLGDTQSGYHKVAICRSGKNNVWEVLMIDPSRVKEWRVAGTVRKDGR